MSTPPVTRPILFSAPMVRALLDGSKTQTRRVFKIRGPMGNLCEITSPDEEVHRFTDGTFHYLSTAAMSGPYPCLYGVAGDRLWVRETFGEFHSRPGFPVYRADDELALGASNPWRPSIHMPRRYSRITLKLTDVRVERLQDISNEDAIAEGIEHNPRLDPVGPCKWRHYGHANTGVYPPTASYESLWESINGPGSWAANPWVWVLQFIREKP